MSYIGNTSTQQAFTPAIDYFSGNGSTVAFTLSRPVASSAQVQVVVNNVPQNPSTAFTVLNSTITFTGAPSSGTNNIYVEYVSTITQVMQPGQGTVGATQLADGSVTPAKMSSGAPSWSALGGVSLPRIDSVTEGGQLNFNRSTDDTGAWGIDVYGSTSTPSLRFVDNVAGATRGSFDGSGNFKFNSGYGSEATAYGCRAWVNFNGTGTVAIRASGNVSSITDNGTGQYTLNFTTAMPDTNYCVTGTATLLGFTANSYPVNPLSYYTGSCSIDHRENGNQYDSACVTVAIFR